MTKESEERQTKLRRVWNWIWARRKGVLETTGALVAIGALIFTAVQTKDVKNAVIQATWTEVNTFNIELDKAFVEHPELWPYFYENKPIQRDDENYNRVMALADLHLDFFDTFDDDYIRSLPGMDDKGEFWIVWEKYFVDKFSRSPALRQRYVEVKDWYTSTGPVAKYYNIARRGMSDLTTEPTVLRPHPQYGK